MASQLVLRTLEKNICRLKLNDPLTRNSLSLQMIQELQQNLNAIAKMENVRVVILQSFGPSFSSGHNLKEIQKLMNFNTKDSKLEIQSLFSQCSELMQNIVALPKPVIAQVDGIATAAGCQLVASCDLAFASSRSSFATPGVNIGLFCSTPAVALSRTVGTKAAMEMLLTGEMISSEKAAEIGLINRSVPIETLDQVVDDYAELIATKCPTAIQVGKPAFYQQLHSPLEDAYELSSKVMCQSLATENAREGIQAFLSKKKPHWKNGS